MLFRTGGKGKGVASEEYQYWYLWYMYRMDDRCYKYQERPTYRIDQV